MRRTGLWRLFGLLSWFAFCVGSRPSHGYVRSSGDGDPSYQRPKSLHVYEVEIKGNKSGYPQVAFALVHFCVIGWMMRGGDVGTRRSLDNDGDESGWV
jgi:hypothetical protein